MKHSTPKTTHVGREKEDHAVVKNGKRIVTKRYKPLPPRTNAIGLPRKVTLEQVEKVCNHIAKGNFFETACQLEGLNAVACRTLVKRGKDLYDQCEGDLEALEYTESDKIKIIFYLGVEKAMATAEAKLVAQLDRHGKREWKAVAFRLERTNPERWGNKQEIKHTGEVTFVHMPGHDQV